jgi:hypothetical protein
MNKEEEGSAKKAAVDLLSAAVNETLARIYAEIERRRKLVYDAEKADKHLEEWRPEFLAVPLWKRIIYSVFGWPGGNPKDWRNK